MFNYSEGQLIAAVLIAQNSSLATVGKSKLPRKLGFGDS